LNETSTAMEREAEFMKEESGAGMTKFEELTKKLESQQKAHIEELERLAEESRRRETELAAENSRLADQLRDLRLSPSGLPPSYGHGLGATDSADPPPYESLQSNSSRPDEIYLNCKWPVKYGGPKGADG
jgi:hypothetical protein